MLLGDGQAGKVYELGGDDAFTLAELAGEISAAATGPSATRTCRRQEYASNAGRLRRAARTSRTSWPIRDLGIARGDLHVTTGHLSGLIGRPTTPMPVAVRAAVSAL